MYEILENENNELIIPKFQSSTLNLLKKEFLLSVLRFERKMIEKSIMATPKSLIRSVYTHTFLFFFLFIVILPAIVEYFRSPTFAISFLIHFRQFGAKMHVFCI